ncbi:MAG: LysM peptidoglycan-binding domain-containing protein [Bacteroidia bacterium]
MRLFYFPFFISLLTGFGLRAQQKAPDELYSSRLASLHSQVELLYNPAVRKYIDEYLDHPEKIKNLVSQGKIYFPVIDRSFKNKNIPLEFKYLAIAVSELNPEIQNPSGSSGLWMMGYNVSKMYKLKVNSFVDERKDPFKSSQAAASHFKDLFSIYKHWSLVIASYGCSPVMLNKCIRMAGNSMYFWDIYPYIPEPTKDLYPKFIAAVYIMNFYREHGIKPITPESALETDSVLVNRWLSFQQISSAIGVPVEQLRKLNPIFRKDIIPFNMDGYWIQLPNNKAKIFLLLKDSLFVAQPKPIDFSPVAIQKEITDSNAVGVKNNNSKEVQPKFEKKKITYTVKKGETISKISDWFDVAEFEIRSWNKLKTMNLHPGQKLIIWVNASKTGYYNRINSMNRTQKKKLKGN